MTSKFSIETTFFIFLKMCNISEIITEMILCFDIYKYKFISCILKGAVTCYLEIVYQGLVRPLTSGQVRPIAKPAPYINKIFARVFCATYALCNG